MEGRMSIGYIEAAAELVGQEPHTADSQWQYCMCKSCQEVRLRIESAPPGTKFDFDKFRHKDERYPPRGTPDGRIKPPVDMSKILP
jgi:hypothetical protein